MRAARHRQAQLLAMPPSAGRGMPGDPHRPPARPLRGQDPCMVMLALACAAGMPGMWRSCEDRPMAGQSCQTLVLRVSRATVLAPNRMRRPGVSSHIGQQPSAPTLPARPCPSFTPPGVAPMPTCSSGPTSSAVTCAGTTQRSTSPAARHARQVNKGRCQRRDFLREGRRPLPHRGS
jgi:hypothetical protein